MTLKDQIVAALKKVYDPEMPVNIYELGPDLRHRRGSRGQGGDAHDAHRAELSGGGQPAGRGGARGAEPFRA